MAQFKKWIGILALMQLQILVADKDTFHSTNKVEMQHSRGKLGKNRETGKEYTYTKQFVEYNNDTNQFVEPNEQCENEKSQNKDTTYSKKLARSIENNMEKLSENDLQFGEFCHESLTCTCFYPDNTDVIQFEMDEIAENATKQNGLGPTTCQDLESVGYTLNGFYLVRFNSSKRVKTVYCKFSNHTIGEIRKTETLTKKNSLIPAIKEASIQVGSIKKSFSKVIRHCGDIGSNPCAFFYPDNPDVFDSNTNIKSSSSSHEAKPTGCKDLQDIGYTHAGFHLVHWNDIKVRIVYCEFKSATASNKANVDKTSTSMPNGKSSSKRCSIGIGSQPCACYRSSSSNILQFELSTDGITRKASTETGVGPASCKDLEKIGHILEGFYMVRFTTRKIKIEYCKFEHLPKEEEFGNESTTSMIPSSSTKENKPLDKIPSLDYGRERGDGKPILLKNEHGKCMDVMSSKGPEYLSENGAFVIQSICNPKEKGQLWKWKNFSRLCNNWEKCLTVDFKVKEGMSTYIMHSDMNGGKKQQKWYITGNEQLKNPMGYCLGVASNSDSPGARLETKVCEKKEKGQLWYFFADIYD